jgi:hypothetical protein
MNYQSFVENDKSLLISPAGYGKTHTIVECLKYTEGRQLILTHTHAGVASIKEKIVKACIDPKAYSVETISSFSQRYLNAFYTGNDIPDQNNKGRNDTETDYHSFVIDKTGTLLLSPLIRRVIKASYNGLFVDEYQDCTILQHRLIMEISNLIPIRILGDPLQGIFDFIGDVVDFNADLGGFKRFPDLKVPYRWYKSGNNNSLGELIKGYRDPLKSGGSITVKMNGGSGLYVIPVSEGDFENPRSKYRKKISSLILNKNNNPDFESLLIIVPEYLDIKKGYKRGGIAERATILSKIDYSNKVVLLEAIDDKAFYGIARDVDMIIESIANAKKPIKKLYDVLSKIFSKTSPAKRNNVGLNDWIFNKPKEIKSDYHIKSKRADDRNLCSSLKQYFDKLIANPSYKGVYVLIQFMINDLNIKRKPRREVLSSLLKSLSGSINNDISVYESMKAHKNVIRRVGRKVKGKCIGTTLLTKGLEFDTVAILDAHRFDCPKNLYVALTRCCKNLVVFTESSKLGPFNVIDIIDSAIEGSGDCLDKVKTKKYSALVLGVWKLLQENENLCRYNIIARLYPALRVIGVDRAHEISSSLIGKEINEVSAILSKHVDVD